MADKEVSIKYVNKDFASLKRDLMRYAQANFSGSFQDFNEASPGMAILEMQAYVADVLAHYIDQSFLETKMQTARQLQNVEDFAKSKGYRPSGKRAARVSLKVIVELPAVASGSQIVPDYSYAPVVKAGTQVQSTTGVSFETLEDLDMGISTLDNTIDLAVSRRNGFGFPTHYAVRRQVQAIAASTTTEEITVGDFVKFKRIPLGNSDVQEVISVFDSDGDEWYQVDFLAQNVVLDESSNTSDDASVVPYVMKVRSAPRRFVLDYSPSVNRAYLQFGPGDAVSDEGLLVPNVADYVIPRAGRRTFTNFSIDPLNFTRTRSLGLSPANTVLTVKYRTGGGLETNVDSNTITSVVSPIVEFKSTSLDETKRLAVQSSLEVNNVERSRGGADAETIAEIKANSESYFAAQMRCVTPDDYIAHVLSMPSRFGKAEKVFITKGVAASNTLQIHMLSKDSDGKLMHPTDTLKRNVQTYLSRLRMMTDGVDILSGKIINIGLDFGVVISSKMNRSEVLTECLTQLRDHFHTDRMQVGQPIVISEIQTILQSIKGVVSVYKTDVKCLFGQTGQIDYSSDVSFDVRGNTENGIIYCPEGAIFEVKFPENDIKGESR
jgi:hypothetical protein